MLIRSRQHKVSRTSAGIFFVRLRGDFAVKNVWWWILAYPPSSGNAARKGPKMWLETFFATNFASAKLEFHDNFRSAGVLSWLDQKTREGCGCPKLLAGKVFRQISTLLENYSPIFWQHEMLSMPRFGLFPARKMAAGKSAPPSGTLLDFLLWDCHSLREFFPD